MSKLQQLVGGYSLEKVDTLEQEQSLHDLFMCWLFHATSGVGLEVFTV